MSQQQTFTSRTRVPVSLKRLWEWHLANGTFARLSPPWMSMRMDGSGAFPGEGGLVDFKMRPFLLWLRWRARIDAVDPLSSFTDRQVQGPFAMWEHQHQMKACGDDVSELEDLVRFQLPWPLCHVPMARQQALTELDRLFRFRRVRMEEDLRRYPDAIGTGKTLLVTGATGLVGRRLVPLLETLGYTVRILSRHPSGQNCFYWNPQKKELAEGALDGLEGVVHLAGEPIAEGRWNAARKAAIRESRVAGTRFLVECLRKEKRPPKAFISASGINYYGSGSGEKDEASPSGEGFLAEVCRAWEAEAGAVQSMGTRAVFLRTGVVLDPMGGALAKMLPAFLFGLGGPIGQGEQGFSWIGMDDLLDIIVQVLQDEALNGPVNAVHPERVTQGTFSRILGSVLRRPVVVPLPACVVRTLFGEMGEETLLADLSIRPRKLCERKFASKEEKR